MRPKGINPLELHVEKIVMAAAVVVVGALGARQFLLPLNEVSLRGENDAKKPEEIDQFINQKARQLETAMQSNRSLENVDAGKPMAQWFQQQFDMDAAEPVHAVVPLTVAMPLKVGGTDVVDTAAQAYAEFTPPAPFEMMVTTRQYSLWPEVVEEDYPELQTIVGESEPYDLPVVHAMAKIDGTALRQTLESPQEERRTIPTVWWQDDMAILDVAMERQELLADGSWSDPFVVPHIPGRQELRDRMEGLRPNEKEDLLREMISLEEKLYQEPFFDLNDGTAWTIDVLRADQPLTPEQEAAVKRYMMALRNRNRASDKLDRYYLVQERERDRDKQQRGTGGRNPGQMSGGEGGGGGGDFGSKGDSGSGSDDQSKKIDTEERLENDLAEAEDALLAAKDEVLVLKPDYRFPDEEEPDEPDPRDGRGDDGGSGGGKGRYSEDPGMGFEGDDGGSGGGEYIPMEGGGGKGSGAGRPGSRSRTGSRDPRRAAEAAALLDNETLEVWTHDINVTPGKTYRYRLMVKYYNPFYGREARLDPSQSLLAESIAYASQPTEWSEPIRVSPPQQFFAVSGAADTSISERRATFEVYLFSGGEHWVSKMSARPGEPIGDVKFSTNEDNERVEIDFFTGAVLLDVLPGKKTAGGMSESVQVVVALEDGTIVTLDTEAPAERSSA